MGKTRRTYSSQTIAEVLLVILIIGVVVAAVMSGMTRKKTDKNWDADSIICVKNEKAADLSSQACSRAIESCKYDRNNACNTIQYYADYSNDEEIANAAKKVFSNTCDQGGKVACQYFITSCQKYNASCDSTGDYDLQYYLNMPPSVTTTGRYLIEDLLKPYYNIQNNIGNGNIKDIVDNTCCSEASESVPNTACAVKGVDSCALQVKIDVGVSGQGYNAAVDSKGNIYVIGSSNWYSGDILIVKMNSSGHIIPDGFVKGISSSINEVGSSIGVDSHDNIIFTGLSQLSTYNRSFIFKMNSSGNLTSPFGWQKEFSSGGINTRVKNLFIDKNDDIHLVGFENAVMVSGNDKNRVFYLKMSTDGVIYSGSQKRIRSSVNTASDYGFGVYVDDNGYIYISENSQPYGSSTSDIMGIIRLDPSYNLNFQEQIGVGSAGSHVPEGVWADTNGNIYSCGGIFSDLFVLKMNKSGNISGSYGFNRRLGSASSDYLSYMTLDNDNNIYTTGYAGSKLLVMKMNSSGNMTYPYGWVKTMSTSDTVGARGWRLIFDGKHSLYVTGYTTTDTDFNGHTPVYIPLILRMDINQGLGDANPFTTFTSPFKIVGNPFSFDAIPNFYTTPMSYTIRTPAYVVSSPELDFR